METLPIQTLTDPWYGIFLVNYTNYNYNYNYN